MKWISGWLLLLSISVEVWSVPIDRNAAQQVPKEEVQEENMVMSHYSVICFFFYLMTCFYDKRLVVDNFSLQNRTLACTTTGTSER